MVFIKGIFFNVSNDELKTELKNLNFKIFIVKFFGFPDKSLLIFLVIISQSNLSKEIFTLDSLFYLKISV